MARPVGNSKVRIVDTVCNIAWISKRHPATQPEAALTFPLANRSLTARVGLFGELINLGNVVVNPMVLQRSNDAMAMRPDGHADAELVR